MEYCGASVGIYVSITVTRKCFPGVRNRSSWHEVLYACAESPRPGMYEKGLVTDQPPLPSEWFSLNRCPQCNERCSTVFLNSWIGYFLLIMIETTLRTITSELVLRLQVFPQSYYWNSLRSAAKWDRSYAWYTDTSGPLSDTSLVSVSPGSGMMGWHVQRGKLGIRFSWGLEPV